MFDILFDTYAFSWFNPSYKRTQWVTGMRDDDNLMIFGSIVWDEVGFGESAAFYEDIPF